MITRTDILSEAIHNCLAEMYRWSQPSIDIDKLIADGFKDDKENPLYDRHYLSQENFIYIRDRFKEAYGITDEWDNTFDTLIKYLVEGGIEDDYKPAIEDRPGYRDYKEVPALETFIGKESTEQCLTLIKKCRDFYKGHCLETNQFDMTMALGVGSPNSCAERVENYWHNNGRPDFTIKEFKVDDVIYGGVNDEYLDTSEEDFIESLK
jgi:hypothetical protein